MSLLLWKRVSLRFLRIVFLLWGVGSGIVISLPFAARAEVVSWIVVEVGSGAVLEKKDPFRPWYPASLTKLMTAYLLFEEITKGNSLSLDSLVTVSQNALAQPPSKMGFPVGTRMTVENALRMLLTKSANDVAVVLAEAVAGSEEAFIERMNRAAAELGLHQTHFVNPHGLPDPQQVSSARDMAVLAKHLWKRFPQYRSYYGEPALRFNKTILKSANREILLRVPGALGMKTGYICNAGYNLVAAVTRQEKTLIAVVFGATSAIERAAHARMLIDTGFAELHGQREVFLEAGRLETLPSPPQLDSLPKDGYCHRTQPPSPQLLRARYGRTATSTAGAVEDSARTTVQAVSFSLPQGTEGALNGALHKAESKGKKENKSLLDQIIGEQQKELTAKEVWVEEVPISPPRSPDAPASEGKATGEKFLSPEFQAKPRLPLPKPSPNRLSVPEH